MKRLAILVPLAILAGCGPSEPGTSVSAVAAPAGYPVCLRTYLVDHTEPVDSGTLLFFMRGGEVWKNTLQSRCIGLNKDEGFVYESPVDEICSNEQTIRMLRSGSLCMLGPFTPISPADAKTLRQQD